MELFYKKHTLQFRFAAGTSRGVYNERDTWIISITFNSRTGIGECSPLKGLSPDPIEMLEERLEEIKMNLKQYSLPANAKEASQMALKLAGFDYPALRFGLESALLDLVQSGKQVYFDNEFIRHQCKIPINGLIWMGDFDFMKKQADEKASHGFKCLKMKVGAISKEQELELIAYIRNRYPDIVLRLDANGAFDTKSAMQRLEELSKFDIHSIEQPIKTNKLKDMQRLCAESPVPIALDEELIGMNTIEEKLELLKKINPQYIILKPTLLGGFSSCSEWITIADRLGIGWWITSMLESNVGLNAIAQYTAEVKAKSFQGLGTGMLYYNNIGTPLHIEDGYIFIPED